ncbi:MAG: hypothetical protein Q9M39_04910 [Sulfurovum sp.]|nr:hypothetical protein [Sulfurovum sp.]
MKKLPFVLLTLTVMGFSVEGVTSSNTVFRPIIKPTLPLTKTVLPRAKPIVNTGLVHQDNYYNTNITSNCDKYIDKLRQKNEEIEALKKEIESLKNKEQAKLQKKLKKEYNAGLKEFENRQSDHSTKSRAIISDKPID